jgi:predicted site-specific integrase-resolvase
MNINQTTGAGDLDDFVLLKPMEVCRVLSISIGTLDRMQRDGRISPIRLTGPRGDRRFQTEDVKYLLRSTAHGPHAQCQRDHLV